jgi:hypothetical protein
MATTFAKGSIVIDIKIWIFARGTYIKRSFMTNTTKQLLGSPERAVEFSVADSRTG